nr:unnamed protein product [Callosobruchus chinensis]
MNSIVEDVCHRSEFISERRRTLFPSDTADSGEDSDLGPIRPLRTYYADSDSDSDTTISRIIDTVEHYDILGVVANKENFCTPGQSKTHLLPSVETMSPLFLSSTPGCSTQKVVRETSPSYKLKTPHDICSTSTKLPKLVRKSLLDSESTQGKRKLSPSGSPESGGKHLKLDSKVRTALFPETGMSLPTKKFYSNTEDIMETIMKRNSNPMPLPKRLPTVPTKIRHTRKKNKRQYGEINAGAAVTPAGNLAITEYIKDLTELKKKQQDKMIMENKENNGFKIESIEAVVPQIKAPRTHDRTLTPVAPLITPAIHVNKPEGSKKRPLSPAIEPSTSKKFFKFSRPKGVVTMNKNIKVKVENGEMMLVEQNGNNSHSVPEVKTEPVDFNASDFYFEEPSISAANIDEILSALDDTEVKSDPEDSQQVVLPVHNYTTIVSDNGVQLHEQPFRRDASCPASIILSPISQMCSVTSGLALSSPKRIKNLVPMLEEVSNNKQRQTVTDDETLFPVFYPRKETSSDVTKNTKTTNSIVKKKFKKISEDQMLLDAGQKRFGAVQCAECLFLYHLGDPSDEVIHTNYHKAIHIFRFQGWKNERVVATINNDRIIQILPNDSKIWLKRVHDLMGTFLYVKNRLIVGCIVAVPASQGFRMLPSGPNEGDFCSETAYPVKCGISRIWVSSNHRRQGVGKALMDAVKTHFIAGYPLDNGDIAMSSPTQMGKSFASKYFGTQNYLVYFL